MLEHLICAPFIGIKEKSVLQVVHVVKEERGLLWLTALYNLVLCP